MAKQLYFVQVEGDDSRLVEAESKKDAREFVAPVVTVIKADAAAVATFMAKGGKVEVVA